MVTGEQLVLTGHALRRLAERNLTVDDVLSVVNANDVIESYPTDTPYPSVLGLAFVGGRPVHVCWGLGPATMVTIITVYVPNPEMWDAAFRVRRTP